MVRYLFILLLSFNFSFANENIVKTSELELFLFKVGFESLLKDVDITKDKSSLNEKEIRSINEKIELIMSELYKDKRVLLNDVVLNDTVEQNNVQVFDKKELENLKNEIAFLKEEVQKLKKIKVIKTKEIEKKLDLEIVVKNNFDKLQVKSYVVYFVAYRDIKKTENAVQKIKKIIGSLYQTKIEEARGFNSGVIYNLETKAEATEIKKKILKFYPDSYVRKINHIKKEN